eukprot:989014-Amphidinium_carterae.3
MPQRRTEELLEVTQQGQILRDAGQLRKQDEDSSPEVTPLQLSPTGSNRFKSNGEPEEEPSSSSTTGSLLPSWDLNDRVAGRDARSSSSSSATTGS